MSAKQTDGMPCGCCHTGIYAPEVVMNGVDEFGECLTLKDALAAAPKCLHGRHICFGARDFIASMTFPLSASDRSEIYAQCGISAPAPILSDFDRLFEEQFPKPENCPARRSVEHVAAGDRPVQPTRFPKARQS